MSMRPSAFLPILFIILSLSFGLASLTFESRKMAFLPAILSGGIFVLSVIQLVRELTAKEEAEEVSAAKPEEAEEESISTQMEMDLAGNLRGELFGFVWLAGLILGVLIFGFLISIPAFVVIYSRRYGASWLASALIATALESFTYFIFVKFFEVELYNGLILEAFLR